MKWKEWVVLVEEKMKEEGIEENPEIFYIDTHMPDDVVVKADSDGLGIMVVQSC